MKILTTLLVSLLILGVFLPLSARSAPDGAWSGVTVLLNDGWRYRDVTVYLDAMGAGLWVLREDGAERLVAMHRISRIIGPTGDEVTDKVLGGLPGPRVQPTPPRPAPSENQASWEGALSAAPLEDQALKQPTPFGVALTLEGGYGVPAGEWYEGFEPSWSAGSRLRIATTQGSYLGLGFHYQDYGVELPGDVADEVSAAAHALIYDATFGWMSSPSPSGTMTYFELGAALLRNEISLTSADETRKFTDNHGAFLVRSGLMLPLGEASALDLGFSWAYKGQVFSEDGEPNGSLIMFHLGLTWMN